MVLINEDEALCLELAEVPKDLEFTEVVLETVLVLDCVPFKKLAGSTRFFAEGWDVKLVGSATRF